MIKKYTNNNNNKNKKTATIFNFFKVIVEHFMILL